MKKKIGVLSELKANPNNPRSIGDWEADALKRALNEFGDLGGVVRNIRTDQLVGGHQRVNQFRSLGNAKVVIKQRFKKPTKRGTIAMGYVEMDGEQFSYREVDWTPAREAAANVAANKHGGEFDMEAMASVLKSIDQQGGDFDFSLTGFNLEELQDLGVVPPELLEEETPVDLSAENLKRLQEKWDTKLGQLWELGEHRLLCGCCRTSDISSLLAKAKINVAFTSPPYAKQREYDTASGFTIIQPEHYVEWFKPVSQKVRSNLAPDGSWFVNIKPGSEGLDTDLYVMDLVIAHAREWLVCQRFLLKRIRTNAIWFTIHSSVPA